VCLSFCLTDAIEKAELALASDVGMSSKGLILIAPLDAPEFTPGEGGVDLRGTSLFLMSLSIIVRDH